MTTRRYLGWALVGLLNAVVLGRSADAPVKAQTQQPFDHECAVGAVAFTADGLYVVSGAEDGVIRVWDRDTGLEVRRLTGHRGRVSSLAVSPDGQTLASGSGDQTVGLWDFASGRLRHRCQGHDGWVRSVRIAPDGKTVASGSYDETVRLWDVATGKELRRLEGHDAPVSAVSFFPDGKALAAGDHENIGRLWDLTTGKEYRQLPRPRRGEMTGLAVCGGGRVLATASANGNLLLWSADTGEVISRLGPGSPLLSLAASADGKLVAAGANDGEVHLVEVASRMKLLSFPGFTGQYNPANFFPTTGVACGIHAVAFSPDASWLAAGTKDGFVRLWRVADLVRGSDRPPRPRPQDLDALWHDLAAPEPPTGFRALARLASAPDLAVPYLKPRLTPVPPPDAARVQKLLAELDDDDFGVRERATEQLAKFAESAGPPLREALRGRKLSAEAAARVRRLLKGLEGSEPTPERLRESRAVQALEWMATPEAADHLRALAKGQAGVALTEEAAQARARLARRVR